MTVPFNTITAYVGVHGHVSYSAFQSVGAAECEAWLKATVAERVYDKAISEDFSEDVEALATDGFEVAGLQEYLDEPTLVATYWDIGESIASLFLIERHGAMLLCNPLRDLRSEKGSLPGADVVGYQVVAGETVFLFGEVKASGDSESPPSVMASSGSGMVVQLTRLATSVAARRRLLFYLKARSESAEAKALWQEATKALGAKKYALTGVLVRDTAPAEKDVEKAAKDLQVRVPVERALPLFILHLHTKVGDWSLHCQPS